MSLRSDISMPAEFVSGQRSDNVSRAEGLSKIQRDIPLQQENLGALAVTGDAPLQLEGTAKFSVDANSQTESSAAVLASFGSVIELLIKVTSDRAALVELLAALSASCISEVEIVALTTGVTGNAALALEFLARLQIDDTLAFEILGNALIAKFVGVVLTRGRANVTLSAVNEVAQ